MLSINLAKELKEAGLDWNPILHDFFAIPVPDLDDRLFVVSDMMIDIQQLYGHQAITFNGAVEWSLDFYMKADAIWIPTEAQLRDTLQNQLLLEPQPAVQLASSNDIYRCEIRYKGSVQIFEAYLASDAYGQALLYIFHQERDPKGRALSA